MAKTTEEGILAKLEAILSRTSRGDDDDDPPAGKTVSYDRFFRANQRAKAAEEALQAITAEVGELKTAQAAALEEAKTSAATAVTELATRHQEDLQLVDLGLDGEGREALRSSWRRLDESSRGKTPAEWWQAQVAAVAAHRKDPEETQAPQIPRTLQAYVPAEEQEDSGGSGGSGGSGRRANVDAGVKRKPPGSAVEKIRSASSFADLIAAVEAAES